MLLVGNNIRSNADALKKVKVEHFYHALRNPAPGIDAQIRRLRIVRHLDAKQYAELKRTLPYVVCGVFNPPFRRTENFAYTEYFMVDIDNLPEKGLDLSEVRERIERDKRVLLSFLSLSEEGLKVLFRLKERCYDAGIYSLFYKTFVRRFSTEYQLEQVVDARTCDVCRACFVSADPAAHYFPAAEPVDLNAFLDLSDMAGLLEMKSEFRKEEEETDHRTNGGVAPDADPEAEVLEKIKKLLRPDGKKPVEKMPVYVPEQLNEIIGNLKAYIEETGIIVYEVLNIQYGKKIRMKVGQRQAEINLFYGKRGFSVVQSPRYGTSSELNQMTADLIKLFLDGNN